MKAKFREDYIRPFVTCYKGMTYHINPDAFGYYALTDSNWGEVVIADYRLEEMADIIEDGAEETNNNPDGIQVMIWHKEILVVAEWLCENHWMKVFKSVDDAEDSIYHSIYGVLVSQKEALEDDPDTNFQAWSGTGGYYVFFQWLDVDLAQIQVLVDPNVAKDRFKGKGVHCTTENIGTFLEFFHDYK